jgi:hypothetical protein
MPIEIIGIQERWQVLIQHVNSLALLRTWLRRAGSRRSVSEQHRARPEQLGADEIEVEIHGTEEQASALPKREWLKGEPEFVEQPGLDTARKEPRAAYHGTSGVSSRREMTDHRGRVVGSEFEDAGMGIGGVAIGFAREHNAKLPWRRIGDNGLTGGPVATATHDCTIERPERLTEEPLVLRRRECGAILAVPGEAAIE